MTFDARELGLRLHAAQAVAQEAGRHAHRRFRARGSFKIGLKGPQDFLTEVDQEVERMIAGRLQALFPDDGLVGEEGAARAAQGEAPTWVIDPIDGTANFARGTPHYCVSIALARGRDMLIGVIYDPALDELFVASRGGGAFLNGEPMRASKTRDLGAAAVEVGWNMRCGADSYLGLLDRVVRSGASPRRSGSGALGLAYVAAGRIDGYVEPEINAWDCLAGNLMVAEAGGYVSDFLGRAGFGKGPLLACAAALADPLREIARAAGIAL